MSRVILNQLKEETVQLIRRLETCVYEDLLQLLQLRDQALAELQSSPNALEEMEKAILKELESYDSILLNRMEQLKDEASVGLQRLTESQLQKRAYESYSSAGSYFIDRRK